MIVLNLLSIGLPHSQSETSNMLVVFLNFVVLASDVYLFCTTGTMVLTAVSCAKLFA